jgi:hypothetical protein
MERRRILFQPQDPRPESCWNFWSVLQALQVEPHAPFLQSRVESEVQTVDCFPGKTVLPGSGTTVASDGMQHPCSLLFCFSSVKQRWNEHLRVMACTGDLTNVGMVMYNCCLVATTIFTGMGSPSVPFFLTHGGSFSSVYFVFCFFFSLAESGSHPIHSFPLIYPVLGN